MPRREIVEMVPAAPVPMRGMRRNADGDHRCTPRFVWEAALTAIGRKQFDCDPATNEHSTVPAKICYDGSCPEMDGLLQPWEGNVWLNFPFSNPMPWVEKSAKELPRIRSLTVLGPNDSSVKWHQRLVRIVDAYAAWPKRFHFPLPGKAKGSGPGPIALYYVGPQSNTWMRIMRDWFDCTVYPGVTDGDRPIIIKPIRKGKSVEDVNQIEK